eukprot:TRINITY_DN993_c0_g2_i2.p1 TRINITY_DN993_c0_g2~~TRINITY_DN993_c0_g2_i2.p1  ORF type:complete len:392 (-),score=83.55 TRINITY_DN993_c0_g2_i2:78-1253(-)
MAADLGVTSFNADHEGLIHAVQLDHFGQRLATASADGCVHVFNREPPTLITKLEGHKGPVWALSWSHPKFGEVLASGGQDRAVVIWRVVEDGDWFQIHRYEAKGSVMALAFAPWEYDLQLAITSSEGSVIVLGRHLKGSPQSEEDGCSSNAEVAQDDATPPSDWKPEYVGHHEGGVFAVCWGPATEPALQTSDALQTSEESSELGASKRIMVGSRRIVTGGADKMVRIWRHDKQTDSWADQYHFPSGEHCDWVRDVAWRPNAGIPSNTIASCADDGTVVIWEQAMAGQQWKRTAKWELGTSAWQCSWSMTGSILAVATSSNTVFTYQEAVKRDGTWDGTSIWEEVVTLKDEAAPGAAAGVGGTAAAATASRSGAAGAAAGTGSVASGARAA